MAAGPAWQTFFLAVLYKFSKEAQQRVFRQFRYENQSRVSPGCGSSTCVYDPKQHVFEITYLPEDGEQNVATLSNLVESHIEEYLANEGVADVEQDIFPMRTAFVHMDEFEMPPPLLFEPGEEPEQLSDYGPLSDWSSRDGRTELLVAASKLNLTSLECLIGCKLALDKYATKVILSSASESMVCEVHERLNRIEKELNRHVEIEHVPHFDEAVRYQPNQIRLRVFCLGKLKDRSLGRVLIPTDWCLEQNGPNVKMITKAWVIRLMRYDIEKQQFVNVKRSVTAPIIPNELIGTDIWRGFEFRGIGQDAPEVVVPEIDPESEEFQVFENPDDESELIEQWRDRVKPGTPPSPPTEEEQHVEPLQSTWSSQMPLREQSSYLMSFENNSNLREGTNRDSDIKTWKAIAMKGASLASSRGGFTGRRGTHEQRGHHIPRGSHRGRGYSTDVSQSSDNTRWDMGARGQRSTKRGDRQQGHQREKFNANFRGGRGGSGGTPISSSNRFQLIDIDDPDLPNQSNDELVFTQPISAGLEIRNRDSIVDITANTPGNPMAMPPLIPRTHTHGNVEAKLVDDSLVDQEEDIEVRIRISTKKRKPAPRASPSALKALKTLRSEFESGQGVWAKQLSSGPKQSKDKDTVKAKKQMARLHVDEGSTEKTLKSNIVSKKVKARVNEKIKACVSNTLEASRTYRGSINIEVQIGQILLRDTTRQLNRAAVADWDDIRQGLGAMESFETAPENFTKAVTSSASETVALLNLLGVVQQEAYTKEAVWELVCLTSDMQEVRICIDAQEPSKPATVKMDERTLGAVYIHAVGRVHDARLVITGADIISDVSTVPGAEYIVNNIYFEPLTDVPHDLETCKMPNLMGRDGELHVETVRLRSTLSYKLATPDQERNYHVELDRIYDLPIDRPHLGVLENAGIFRARAINDQTLVALQRLWYEMRIRDTRRPAHFDENETLSLGGQVKWTPADVMDMTSLTGLEKLARQCVDDMDSIGFANKGPAIEVEQRIEARRQIVPPADVFW